MFPAGDTLAIKSKKLNALAAMHPYQRQERIARLELMVGQLWFDSYLAQESILLIHRNYELFEQLVSVAESSYSSAMRKTRQNDVIRAHLELTRLDDKLTNLHKQYDDKIQKLGEWIEVDANTKLSSKKPELNLDFSNLDIESNLIAHPMIRVIDKRIEAQKHSVDIAEQRYKPSWGLTGSYAYRDDAPNGMERADFFSVGVTIDLPIFTTNRQDKSVKAEKLSVEALRIQRQAQLKAMKAELRASLKQLARLEERQKIYQRSLLPKMHQQAETSLTAYTNDDGDFAEVMRSRIAVLDAELEYLKIDVLKLKKVLSIKYFVDQSNMPTQEKNYE